MSFYNLPQAKPTTDIKPENNGHIKGKKLLQLLYYTIILLYYYNYYKMQTSTNKSNDSPLAYTKITFQLYPMFNGTF